MDAKIVEADGKKTAVELFQVEPSKMSCTVVEFGSRASLDRLTTVELPKGEYLAMTEKIEKRLINMLLQSISATEGSIALPIICTKWKTL